MSYFQNEEELLQQGNVPLRTLLLKIAKQALDAAGPYQATRNKLSFDGHMLTVANQAYAIEPDQKIFVIGAGKASFPIAKAVDEVLGSRIDHGLVICKQGQTGAFQHIEMRLASHPVPDDASMSSAAEVVSLMESVTARDIVICCFTGGSSALFVSPVAGVSLAEKSLANQILLTCGANIIEINNVRKHISTVKGGRLIRDFPAGTTVINLTVSDVIGDELDYITDPSVADRSTFKDALATVDKYGLWDRLPKSIVDHLRRGDQSQETVREHELQHLIRQDVVLVPGDAACFAAAEAARQHGLQPILLSTLFEGESRELGRAMGAMSRQILQSGHPSSAPCMLIGGGETTVHILPGTKPGKGGPNQEWALAVALEIQGNDQVAALGIDTDGTDGPTPFAGGIVDGDTCLHAANLGLDLHACLQRHDVSPALEAMGAAVRTGSTGTNVNDLKLIVISTPKGE